MKIEASRFEMLIEKKEIKACCGRTQPLWNLSQPISLLLGENIQNSGFFSVPSYAKIGMIYLEDKNIIVSGVLGMTELTIRCKSKKCQDSLVILEKVILNVE